MRRTSPPGSDYPLGLRTWAAQVPGWARSVARRLLLISWQYWPFFAYAAPAARRVDVNAFLSYKPICVT